jgi:hypothetical protein
MINSDRTRASSVIKKHGGSHIIFSSWMPTAMFKINVILWRLHTTTTTLHVKALAY